MAKTISFSLKNDLSENIFVQGPLAGVSTSAFRRLIWRYSKPAYTYTEMMSAKTLLYQQKISRFLSRAEDEGPVAFQLSSNNPAELSEAVKIAEDHGAALIDLNCGCPVNKIRKRHLGSKILSDTPLLYQLIKSMKAATKLPISIKIRVAGPHTDIDNKQVATTIKEGGADVLVVHGRHWQENYDHPCRYDDIQFFAHEMSIPVIGNGDVASLSTLKKLLNTGVTGIMISRASMGRPWLMAELSAALNHQPYTPPAIKEQGLLFIEHSSHLATLLNHEEQAICEARKFAKYYARSLNKRDEFCQHILQCVTLKNLIDTTLSYFNYA